MSVKEILAIAVLVVIVCAPLFWLVSFIRRPYSSLPRGKSTSAFGGILQEIDRLIARPSVEHKVKAEQTTHKRDDDIGGE